MNEKLLCNDYSMAEYFVEKSIEKICRGEVWVWPWRRIIVKIARVIIFSLYGARPITGHGS